MIEVKLPELGEGIEKAVVSSWYVKAGELVNKEDDVVEMVTDKASFNVYAPASGRIREIFYTEGQEARIGAVLATITE